MCLNFENIIIWIKKVIIFVVHLRANKYKRNLVVI